LADGKSSGPHPGLANRQTARATQPAGVHTLPRRAPKTGKRSPSVFGLKYSKEYLVIKARRKELLAMDACFNRFLKKLEKGRYVCSRKAECRKRRYTKKRSLLLSEINFYYTPDSIKKIIASEFFQFCLKINDYFMEEVFNGKTHLIKPAMEKIGTDRTALLNLKNKFIDHLKLIADIQYNINKQSKSLSDQQIASKYLKRWYVEGLLRRQFGINYIPYELVNAKRQQLQFYREFRKIKKEA
jgi:hypothetical protein